MDDNSQMPFGKYFGQKMANIPASYLKWLWDSGAVSVKKWNKVYWYIKENADALNKELREQGMEEIEVMF